MKPEQLGDFSVPSDPQMHPDEDRVAFVVSQMDLQEDEYRRQIWVWHGSHSAPFAAGHSDTSPRWSPSGDRLAFIRKSKGKGTVGQVAVMAASGGEAAVVSEFELGVRELVWLPDGSGLIVVAVEWIEGLKDVDEDERSRLAKHIPTAQYRGDNLGYTYDKRTHVWRVSLDGSDAVCLTEGDFNEWGIAVSPDGGTVAFLSQRHNPDGVLPGAQVFTVPTALGPTVNVSEIGTWSSLAYSRDGALHVVGVDDEWAHPTIYPLQRITVEGIQQVTFLDYNFESSPPSQPTGPAFLEDGRIYSTLEYEGRVHVVSLQGDSSATLVGGDRWIGGFSARTDGTALAFVASDPTDPGELYWYEDGTETRLTSLNDKFKKDADLVAPQEFSIEHDGVSIAGWVYLPEGGSERVPLLFNIHGGPATQYGYNFFDEFQMYVGAGYGVVATNPRGSSGYGREHLRAAVGRWHEAMPPDMLDILATVDVAAAAFPCLDLERMGIMGGSYGGWAVGFVLASDDRFKSAVSERGLYNFISFIGTSDIGPWFTKMMTGFTLPDDFEKLWSASPLSVAHRIVTPTLALHSEAAFRCPIEQGEQFFTALKSTGCEAELVRFPSPESHELSRGGSPIHRLERFNAILQWHEPRLHTQE